MHAREFSTLKPDLDAAGIRMVAVGVEELGVEAFVQGKFFDGEVYIDTKKQLYKDLGYKRLGFMEIMRLLFTRKFKEKSNEAKKLKIPGNFKGDGFQSGGVLIVKQDGEILMNYKQDNPAETVSLDEVMKAVGVSQSAPSGAEGGVTPEVVCDEQACSIKK